METPDTAREYVPWRPALKVETRPPLAHPRMALDIRFIGGQIDRPGLWICTEMDVGALSHRIRVDTVAW